MLKDNIDNFIDAPLWKRLSISSVVFFVIIGFFYYFVLMTQLENISREETKLLDLQKEIQVLRVKANRLPEFEEEVKVLDGELSRALKELPDRKEMDTLLSRISDKAKDSGLDVELFSPQGEIKRDFYAEVPVSLVLRGDFHEIAGFFDEVAHLDRIVNMNNFSISKESDKRNEGKEGLLTKVIATSFRFLDEAERPKEEDQKGGKRRGKKK